MPSPTYVALAKTVLTGTQAEITFSSIPSTYTDLLILASTRSNRVSTVGFVKIRFNGATADTNLTARFMYGGNSTVTSSTESYGQVGISDAANSGANTFASFEIYLPNYAGSTAKPISSTSASEDNSTSNTYIQATASLFNSTTAISSITLLLNNSDSFVSGSRFDLYGIKNS